MFELVAARAELGGEERRSPRRAGVWKARSWRGALRGQLATWRPEPPVLSDMAGGAHEALSLQRGVVDGAALGLLLGQWRVARQTQARRFRIAPPELVELARDPWPHALRVQGRPPVRELGRMACAAALERGFEWRETGGWGALCRERPPPMAAEKVMDGASVEGDTCRVAGNGNTREQNEGGGGQRRPQRRKHNITTTIYAPRVFPKRSAASGSRCR